MKSGENSYMEREEVIEKAFIKACKFLCQYPPSEEALADLNICSCIYWGDSDPEGTAWAGYFIRKVLLEEGK